MFILCCIPRSTLSSKTQSSQSIAESVLHYLNKCMVIEMISIYLFVTLKPISIARTNLFVFIINHSACVNNTLRVFYFSYSLSLFSTLHLFREIGPLHHTMQSQAKNKADLLCAVVSAMQSDILLSHSRWRIGQMKTIETMSHTFVSVWHFCADLCQLYCRQMASCSSLLSSAPIFAAFYIRMYELEPMCMLHQ